MSRRVDMRVVIERFTDLKLIAEQHYKTNRRDVDLHDAAMRYADAVRRVARAKRAQ